MASRALYRISGRGSKSLAYRHVVHVITVVRFGQNTVHAAILTKSSLCQ